MSAAKKQEKSSSWVSAVLGSLAARQMGIVLAALLLLFGAARLAWLKHRDMILSAPEYQVVAETVEITPLPPWIHSDLRGEVFRDAALYGPLSLMDETLNERLARAFAAHPWVAKVQQVRKKHPGASDPASVTVALVYRRPVCMVEVPGGLLPVDSEGVLLPSGDFSPSEAARYPRVQGVERSPNGSAGTRWGDAKVVGAAEIATVLGPAWDSLKLARIVPLPSDPAILSNIESNRRTLEPFFAVFTRGGTRVLWGYAPGANALGEIPPQEKVARLLRYVERHDSLEGRDNRPQEIDVRTLPASTGP